MTSIIRDLATTAAVVLLLLASGPARAQAPEDDSALAEAFAATVSYTFGASRQPLSTIEAQAWRSLRDDAARAEMEQRLLDLLDHPEATGECKSFVCRQLAVVGTARSVVTLRVLLRDPQLSHLARSALEAIPGRAATDALRSAWSELAGDLQAGVFESLVRRGDAPAPAVDPLDDALSLAASGKRDLAAASYRTLYLEGADGTALPPHQRLAALVGWAHLAPEDSCDSVVALLAESDAFWQGCAERVIITTPGRAATNAYARRLAELAPHVQVRLVEALAARGDRAAAEPVAALLRSGEDTVRAAAIPALGEIGGRGQVPILVKLAARGEEAAGSSLARLRGDGIDRAIAAHATSGSADERVVVARTLGARRARDARDGLRPLTEVGQPGSVRTAALVALGQMRQPRRGEDPGEMYRRAMEVAGSPREKRWVLEALEELGDMRQLPLALAWLEDNQVGREAGEVAIAIASDADTSAAEAASDAISRVVQTYPEDQALRRQAGAAISRIESDEGFIRRWAVAGPFFQDGVGGGDLFDVTFEPEPGHAKGEIGWRPVAAEEVIAPGVVDLRTALGGDDRAAYLLTVIHCDRDRPARLEIGSDDGLKVWLDDVLVHANDVMRGLQPGQDVFEVSLRAGANRLLLKITQGGGDWQACCRVRDAYGFRIEGLRFEAP